MMKKLLLKGFGIGMLLVFLWASVNSSIATPILEQRQLSISLTSEGTILYVGGSGPGNYSKIQDAIDNATDGDTVFVFDDSSPYYEFLSINTSLSLIGEEKNTTVINGSSELKVVVRVTADGVVISGFTVINYGREAILIQSNYTRISDTILGPQLSGWSGNGIRLFRTHDCVILDNDISHTFHAIEVIDSDHNIVQKNHLTDNYMCGVGLSDSSTTIVTENVVDTGDPVGIPGSYVGIRLAGSANNTIISNTIISRDEDCFTGMRLWDSTNNTVRENTFQSCGFFWYGSYENIIEGNTIDNKPLVYLIGQPQSNIDNAGQVILIQCSDSTVHDVEITNTPNAIQIIESDNCVITNTTCQQNDYGIRFESSKNVHVTHNTVVNNNIGIHGGDGTSRAVITDNVVQGSRYMGIYTNGASTTIERNIVDDNNAGIMTGGIFALNVLIQSNNITNNWAGISLNTFLATITKNSISGNTNGVYMSGYADRNMIISNTIKQNEYGVNITYDIDTSRSVGNWILKNNFIGNTHHAFFDSARCTHWIRNYWQGNLLPPYRINGMKSYYRTDAWGAIIWEKHIPWVNFDWLSAIKPYTIS